MGIASQGVNMLLYVKRNDTNEIILVSKEITSETGEPIADNDPEILAFFDSRSLQAQDHAVKKLKQSDLDMIRVIEDLIDVLINKNIITFTDFPEISQSKIVSRQAIRQKLREII